MRAVLTYHSIDPSGSPISVSPAAFRGHVEWLASGRVRVLPLDALLDADPDADAVALTFDDGFVNFADEAAPWLLEQGLPVTVFAVTDHVGGTNTWTGQPEPGIPVLPLLGWDDLARLAERGVTIGSHTRRHPRLAGLDPAALEAELAESADAIGRRLGCRPRWFAYPYGSTSPAAVAAVARHYQGAVTTDYRLVEPGEDRLQVPRLDAYYFGSPRALDRWATPGFRRTIWLRRQARRARSALERTRSGA